MKEIRGISLLEIVVSLCLLCTFSRWCLFFLRIVR